MGPLLPPVGGHRPVGGPGHGAPGDGGVRPGARRVLHTRVSEGKHALLSQLNRVVTLQEEESTYLGQALAWTFWIILPLVNNLSCGVAQGGREKAKTEQDRKDNHLSVNLKEVSTSAVAAHVLMAKGVGWYWAGRPGSGRGGLEAPGSPAWRPLILPGKSNP